MPEMVSAISKAPLIGSFNFDITARTSTSPHPVICLVMTDFIIS